MKTSFLIILLVAISNVNAQTGQGLKLTKHYNLENNGKAINGYDLVSYSENSAPKKGSKRIQEKYKGATYYFSSEGNRTKFKSNPQKYLPAYGGWCAYAMADGKKVSVDPETFKIVDDTLYLFYNRFFNNTLNSWNENEKGYKTRADVQWSNILGR
ncbi:YHS domain-containing (seleno)protein [uncultured Aquimarina sp.]|uniref:YHS domain-containing (seleno)protein n=1 Tax=uncultured Aquimarina sp. TaxID=575652 RepID=UPI00261E9EEE|nr:YHS domain-containing (seleno)protein [uncultured Aquimarina sp.]